jgi:hypothetical protein
LPFILNGNRLQAMERAAAGNRGGLFRWRPHLSASWKGWLGTLLRVG